MGSEAITLILSVTAVAFLVFILGRVLTTALKILLLVLLVLFVASRIDFKALGLCKSAQSLPFRSTVVDSFCR